MDPLTDRQQEILDFIQHETMKNGYAPTIREIGERLGIRSTNGVNDHLKALERKGYIRRDKDKSRTLRLTRHPASTPPGADGAIRALTPPSPLLSIPILGRVAAGEPILAEEQALGRVQVDSFFVGTTKKVFALKVVGDSMIEDGIHDGDYLFVKKQAHANKGEIVIAMIEGEATCKRFFPEGDRVRFQPANARLKPIYVSRDQFRETQILGVVCGVYRQV
ncbi:MAG: transcriptional repressor LexA [Deltaproteobacteria bacterium]|nr:transcriptional repressor LexA [Deltaproteobacteria bacterium]